MTEQARARFERTASKVERGDLPAPREDLVSVSTGNEALCDGCGDPITPTEDLVDVNVRGLVALRFHYICYSAWIALTR